MGISKVASADTGYDFIRTIMGNNGKTEATTYTLQVKRETGSSIIRRIETNESASTNTRGDLCKVLNCALHDIIEYLPDEP